MKNKLLQIKKIFLKKEKYICLYAPSNLPFPKLFYANKSKQFINTITN